MTPEPIRVLIADDHPIYRDGLARLLADLDGFEVVGGAADGAEAVALADTLAPDVIIMDLRMPGLDGIEATRRITSASPHIAIVVLSMRFCGWPGLRRWERSSVRAAYAGVSCGGDGLGAVADLQLGEDVGHVVAYRAFAEE